MSGRFCFYGLCGCSPSQGIIVKWYIVNGQIENCQIVNKLMSWFEALILGIIQGLTEYLPVSSSGHLAIGQALFGMQNGEENLMFTVAVHVATVLSTFVILWSEIDWILKGLFKVKLNDETKYALNIIVSMIPVGIVGVFFKDYVEEIFGSGLLVVGCCLLITASLLTFSYFAKPRQKEHISMLYWRIHLLYTSHSSTYTLQHNPCRCSSSLSASHTYHTHCNLSYSCLYLYMYLLHSYLLPDYTLPPYHKMHTYNTSSSASYMYLSVPMNTPLSPSQPSSSYMCSLHSCVSLHLMYTLQHNPCSCNMCYPVSRMYHKHCNLWCWCLYWRIHLLYTSHSSTYTLPR